MQSLCENYSKTEYVRFCLESLYGEQYNNIWPRVSIETSSHGHNQKCIGVSLKCPRRIAEGIVSNMSKVKVLLSFKIGMDDKYVAEGSLLGGNDK